MPILNVRQLGVRFGGIIALDDVSFDIEPRQIVGLIGPNGAGKTTLFNCLSRLYQPSSGSISFEDHDLLESEPHEIAGLGIGRTFQNLALFGTMSVLDNVMVGAHSQTRSGFLACALRAPGVIREEEAQRQSALETIRFMSLEAVAHLPVAGLPFATLKRVEAARALAAKPKLLLMDEPAGGLNHEEVASASDAIAGLAAGDGAAYGAAVIAIVEDFAGREEHLTGVRIADTAAMLEALAAPRGLAAGLDSPLLPR